MKAGQRLILGAIILIIAAVAVGLFAASPRGLGTFQDPIPATLAQVRTKAHLPVLKLPSIALRDPCTGKTETLSLHEVEVQINWTQAVFGYSHNLQLQESHVSGDFLLTHRDGIVRGHSASFYLNETYPPDLKPPCGQPGRSIGWVDNGVLFEMRGYFTWEALVHLANEARFLNYS